MLIPEIPIFCLNLDRAAERWARMQQSLTELGHTVTRFAASDHQLLRDGDMPAAWRAGDPTATSSGNAACSFTHYRFWQFLESSDLDMACVLEDDAQVLQPIRNLSVPDGFDMFYLSQRVQIASPQNPLLINGCGTEAYIVHRRALPKLLQIFSDATVPVDLRLQAHMRGFQATGHSLCAPVGPDTPPAAAYRSRMYPNVILDVYGMRKPIVQHDDQGYSYINEHRTA